MHIKNTVCENASQAQALKENASDKEEVSPGNFNDKMLVSVATKVNDDNLVESEQSNSREPSDEG